MFKWLYGIRSRITLAKQKRHHDRVVNDYREFAAAFGDGLSYAYLGRIEIQDGGKWLKAQECLDRLDELEVAYAALGYRIITIDDWISHGGYGRKLDDVWLVKRKDGEKPIFTRDLRREP